MSEVTPPVDPRTELPPFGSLPPVTPVDEIVTRVIAPNPSPMTLDGTNSYVIADGHGSDAVVVDPGPVEGGHEQHWTRVRGVLLAGDHTVTAVVATHHHPDHAEAAPAWAARLDCLLVAARPDVAGAAGRVVGAGDVVTAGDLRLEVVATPGHTADSISLRLPTGALCTGDHILGRGTTVVAHPDGTIGAYLESLRRVLDLGPAALLPGHGPAVTEDPAAVLRFHLDHREFRLDQVRRVLEDRGGATAAEVVEVVYAGYDRAVWPAATASTAAAFAHLAERGEVSLDGERAVPA